VDTCSLAGETDVLTRESSCDEVDRFKVVRSNVSDVRIPCHLRPVFGEDAPAIVVNLHLPPHLHPGPFQAEVDATDAGEEATHRKHIPTSRISAVRMAHHTLAPCAPVVPGRWYGGDPAGRRR